MAVISGPSFAVEVANKKPTAVTIASSSKNFRNQLAEDLSDQNFRVYTSDDIIGAEIGGAIKNIIAIGAINNVSINRPISDDTLIFFLINPYKLKVSATVMPIHGILFN